MDFLLYLGECLDITLKIMDDLFERHKWTATFATIAVTISLAAWQVRTQFENSLRLQRTNKIDDLHLQIYNDISDKIAESEDVLSSVDTTVRILPSVFETKICEDRIAQSAGLAAATYAIKFRAPFLNDEYHNAMKKIIAVISVMEKYEIAFNNFTKMKEQILESHSESFKAFANLQSHVFRYLPVDLKDVDKERFGVDVFNPPLPDDNVMNQIHMLTEAYLDISMNLAAYLHDLRIEAQNELLSPLFNGKKATVRAPEDPKYRVLTVDNR